MRGRSGEREKTMCCCEMPDARCGSAALKSVEATLSITRVSLARVGTDFHVIELRLSHLISSALNFFAKTIILAILEIPEPQIRHNVRSNQAVHTPIAAQLGRYVFSSPRRMELSRASYFTAIYPTAIPLLILEQRTPYRRLSSQHSSQPNMRDPSSRCQ